MKKGNFKVVSIIVFFALVLFPNLLHAQELDLATSTQNTLNTLPAILINGKLLKFEFGGNKWLAKVDGVNYLAGIIESENNISNNSGDLILKQTHTWEVILEATAQVTGKVAGAAAGRAAGSAASKIPGVGGIAGRATEKVVGGAVEKATEDGIKTATGRWVEATGTNIVLVYNVGPPATLSKK